MKKFNVINIGIIIVLVCLSVTVVVAKTDIIYLRNFKAKKVILPIKNSNQAINFFLSNIEIKKEISRKGKWWVKANLFDPVNFKNVWIVVLGDGDGECDSPHQCYMHINSDGTIREPLHCSDGWNCD